MLDNQQRSSSCYYHHCVMSVNDARGQARNLETNPRLKLLNLGFPLTHNSSPPLHIEIPRNLPKGREDGNFTFPN